MPDPTHARSLLAPGARLRPLWTGGAWCEGPVWLSATREVVFSDIPGDRMLAWSAADARVRVFRAPSRFANGNAVDAAGRLVTCEHGSRSVVRLEADGRTRTLAERHDGRRLNSPNDVAVAPDGAFWFTDPPYGILSSVEGHAAAAELDGHYLFRLDVHTGVLAVAADGFEAPNGLAFSPNGSVLYVSDTGRGIGGRNHHVVAFDVGADARLGSQRVFAIIEPGRADGMAVDELGRLWAATDASVQVFDPDGHLAGRVPLPEKGSNCCFGGDAGTTLFVTAGGSLYAIETAARGARTMQGRASEAGGGLIPAA